MEFITYSDYGGYVSDEWLAGTDGLVYELHMEIADNMRADYLASLALYEYS